MYEVLNYLCSESLAFMNWNMELRPTYPNSTAPALYGLHLRGEAALLLVTVDIGSHGRAVMLLAIRAASNEGADLSWSYKWRLMVLNASERLNGKWWGRVSAIPRCGISR